jgi:TRAP transporter 4TM/12TM fusion protein
VNSIGEPSIPRRDLGLPTFPAVTFVVLTIALSLFQLYIAGVRPLGLFYERGFHLAVVQVLAFLLFPTRGRVSSTGGRVSSTKGRAGLRVRGALAWMVDGVLIAGSIFAALYLTLNLDAIVGRAGAWSTADVFVGTVAVVTLLEASRRALGWPISFIATCFIGYGYAGPFLPGVLRHGGYSTGRLVGQLYLGQEGIYGIPLGVASSFVFIFILFGALLEVTGAGKFFIDLAYALTGRQRGGPAKAAVLASAAMGSISGSAIANVVTSGAFTIPLMKKVGYRAEEAGGIEAAASTGGQILPPIMGAGAFLMAEYTGLPYLEVVKAAVIPAILYMGTVFVFVHIVAVARNLEGLPASQLPRFGTTLAKGWHFLMALVVLMAALLMDFSVARVGFLSCLAVAALAAARAVWDRTAPGNRRDSEPGEAAHGPRAIWVGGGIVRIVDAFVIAGRNTLPMSLACAVAGIMVGIVGLTGLGLKFSSLMLSLSQGNLFLALLLLLLASLVLGMGLPVTASYVILIVLAGPVLINEFGLPVLIAHMLVFWYSQDSNVTPPVCLAAYAAAGVAGSDPMRTGFQAWKYAKGLYLIPLLMVVHPELALGGAWPVVAGKAMMSMVALAAFAAALEGQSLKRLTPGGRIVLLAGASTAFFSSFLVGGLGALFVVGYTLKDVRKTGTEPSAP